jgi:hypothetical protein
LADGPSFPSGDITAAALALPSVAASPAAPSPAAPVAPAAPSAPTSVSPAEIANAQAQTELPDAVAAPAVPAAPSPLSLDPDALYEVPTTVDGKTTIEVLTGKQVTERNMNNRKFTQTMQQVREFERSLAQERQGIVQLRQQAELAQQIMSNPERARQVLSQRFPQLFQPAPVAAPQYAPAPVAPPQQVPASLDPQAIPLFSDVQAAIDARAQALSAEMGRDLNAKEQAMLASIEQKAAQVFTEKIQALQNANEVASYDRQINSHIDKLKEAHPVLAQMPQLNDLLRWEVSQMNPRNPQEMLALFDERARALAEGFDEHYAGQQRVAQAVKAKLTSHGVEPPTGRTPTITPVASKPFVKGGKADWGSLDAAVRAYQGSR